MEHGIPVPLDIIECWDRNIPRTLERDVLALAEPRRRGHGRHAAARLPAVCASGCSTTARAAGSREALGRYPHVDVAAVPYYFVRDPPRPTRRPVAAGVGRWTRLSASMRVIIMGCGRVGSDLPSSWSKAATTSPSSTSDASGFREVPAGSTHSTVVGLGFDRDILEEAGIKEADAFVAVSSGDNSNIVSARVALEHYHVPKVIARIYDPRRAEIYERLNIPTVATTKWGVKQIQLMLFHDRTELRESMGGGDLLRMRVPVPPHLVGKPATSLNVAGQDPGGRRLARRRRIPPHATTRCCRTATTSP